MLVEPLCQYSILSDHFVSYIPGNSLLSQTYISLNSGQNTSDPRFRHSLPHYVLQRPSIRITTSLPVSNSQRSPLSTVDQNIPCKLNSPLKPGALFLSDLYTVSQFTRIYSFCDVIAYLLSISRQYTPMQCSDFILTYFF